MCKPYISRLLEQSNDIEKNPGPLPHRLVKPMATNKKTANKQKEPEKNEIVKEPHVQFQSFEDLRTLVERQNEQIQKQSDEIKGLRKKVDENEKFALEFRSELGEVRKKWQSLGDIRSNPDELTSSKIESLVGAYNDIQDRLYEIDKSWKNNLIFYGIPTDSNNDDEDPYATEEKVRDLIKRKLRITREIPFNRVSRVIHGPEFRGHKPIQVHFANYNDKEDILRKAKLLKGVNIHISEDFSRKVREHRQELNKFMKEVRSRDPARRMVLRYDKLYMGNDVFFYNDKTGRVERIHNQLETRDQYNTLVDSVFTSDAQHAHDSSWMRRPRSKYSSRSRPITPVLSRQNSMSMDDISQDEYYGTPQPTPMRSRPVTGRNRERGMPKSASIDSLHYENSTYPASPHKARSQNPEDIRKSSDRYQNNSSPRKSRQNHEYYTNKCPDGQKNNQKKETKNDDNSESDDTDRNTPDDRGKTPEPTFQDEPRYNPPETPKRSPKPSPTKTEPNPLLKLAMPRSARERERKISFKDEKEKDKPANGAARYKSESELDLSDDEAEQDEVLSLDLESKTFTQEIREAPQSAISCKSANPVSNAIPLKGPKEANTCTEMVPLFPPISKKSSSTDLVPVERVEIKSLSNFRPSFSTSITPSTRLAISTAQNSHSTPYNFTSGFAGRPASTASTNSSGSIHQVQQQRQSVQGGHGGVLKLNVAIAGEFSMGNFGNNQHH